MKKKIIITIAVILAVFILGISAGTFIINGSLSISTGHVLVTENGTCFLIKGNSPVRLSDYGEGGALPELKTGDKVLAIHGAIAESYPASTLCRLCIKTGDGSISDIPEEVISSMTELGWISEKPDNSETKLDFEAQYVKTALPSAFSEEALTFPQYDVIRNTDELKTYNEGTELGINEDFISATEKYTDEFFESSLLFIAHVQEGSGSNTHKVTDVIKAEGKISIHIKTITPETGTCDMAYHRIITELKKSDVQDSLLQLFFNGKKVMNNPERVSITTENANVSLLIPEGWRYESTKTENDGFDITNGFEISLFHEEDAENNVTIAFTDGFGVCGTGLRTKEIPVNGYSASMGIYDGDSTFSYIVFDDTPGFYVIHNYADALWWHTYEDDLRAIFSTLHIAEGMLFREEALAIAEKLSVGENKEQYGEFDPATGIWSFVFETAEASEIIKIDKNGNIA